MRTLLLLVIAPLLLNSCSKEKDVRLQPVEVEKIPLKKNIILMIGDGMGLTHITGARTVNGGKLNMLTCSHIGIQSTHAVDKYVTDSGAATTAIACGQKTNHYYLGVDTDGNPLESILEMAVNKGLSTGLITTSSIVHATPAGFYAHTTDRFDYEGIALELLSKNVDFLAGGGLKFFNNRSDGLNLVDSLLAKGYNVIENLAHFTPEKKTIFFMADEHPVSIPDGRGPLLRQSLEKALQSLHVNENGFFLMVEGAQIDWAGEENDQEFLIEEMLDFDSAVGVALDFAKKDGNTLVVITGDHETAGFSLLDGSVGNNTIEGHFATWLHTGAMVPVFAKGPGAESFTGVYENTAFFYKFKSFYGF
jgi:alkaline phosphatase